MKNLLKFLVLVGIISFGLSTSAEIDVSTATLSASYITSNSARVTSSISLTDNVPPLYVEYGPTQSFGYFASPTAPHAVGVPVNFLSLDNLLPNTTYYYRLVQDINHCIQSRYTEIPCLATVNPYSKTYSFKTLDANGNADISKAILSVSNINSNSVTITSNISLSDKHWVIEYSADQSAWLTSAPGIQSEFPVNFVYLHDLLPNTTYYYHLYEPMIVCAQNNNSTNNSYPLCGGGGQKGPTYSFKTLSYNNQELVINKTLRYGMRDEQVKILQRLLGLKIDGSFGMLTKKAVMRFQLDRGLKADGIFGPKSNEKFHTEGGGQGGLGGGSTSARCTANNGTWSEQYKECGGIGADSCKAIGGTYNGCASACRHDPNAQMCTMNCVQVCTL